MAKSAFEIEGLALVKRAFEQLEPRVARKVIRQAERDAAKAFKDEIAAHVPVASGRLKKSLKVRASKGPRGAKKTIAIAVLVGQAGGAAAQGLKTAWYAYLQEKGYHIGKRHRRGGKVTGYSPTGARAGVVYVPGKRFVKGALRSREGDVRRMLLQRIRAGIDREAKALGGTSR